MAFTEHGLAEMAPRAAELQSQSGGTGPKRTGRLTLLRFLFASGITLSAFLLFNVQLLMSKYILPWFGGTAGVWTTSLLFFQTALLAGYCYAHVSVSKLALRSQAKLHTTLLVVSVALMGITAFLWTSPITPGPGWKPQSGEIAVWLILRVLLGGVGAAAILLSTTGLFMQHWFARVCPGDSPYRLYALSNVGSLLGLLSYPFVAERMFRLHTQAWIWCTGYALFVIIATACATMSARSAPEANVIVGGDGDLDLSVAPPSRSARAVWFLFAALGSLMLVATSNFLTKDLAPIPLLWVLPLAVYLISFIVCFDHPRWYRPGLFHFFLLATTLITILFYGGLGLGRWTFIAVFLVSLLACCCLCHGELYRRRPQSKHLTSFYLMIALGGVAGSAFVNLIAPFLFKGYWEMQFGTAICLSLMAVMAIRDKTSWVHRQNAFIFLALISWSLLTAGFLLRGKPDGLVHFVSDWPSGPLAAVAVVCLLLAFRPPQKNEGSTLASYSSKLIPWCLSGMVIAAAFALIWAGTRHYRMSQWAQRNFYSMLYIQKREATDPRFNFNVLTHEDTYHGTQLIAPESRRYATSYYSKNSGVGLALLNYPRQQNGSIAPRSVRVGAIGLGVGTIATYGLPGDLFRFYEIDPEVVRVASGKYGYFSFLSDSRARVEIVEGDARISLERELAHGQAQTYDVLVVDAFSGDVVPIHLLTKEAFELYVKYLRDEDSVIAVHISNRTMDLASVVAKEAEYFHLHTAFIYDPGYQGGLVPSDLFLPSRWILLSRNSRVLSLPAVSRVSGPIPVRHAVPLWTDDYSNLLQILW